MARWLGTSSTSYVAAPEAPAASAVGDEARLGLLVRLGERAPDRATHREKEGVGHSATDREGVDARDERAKHVHLCADLGAANDRDERVRRLVEYSPEHDELLLEEQPGVRREQVRDAFGRRVCAVGRPERIVHIDVEARGKLLCKGRIVPLFLRMEADVLEHDEIAGLQRADCLFDIGPNRLAEKRHRLADELGEALRDWSERGLRVGPLRSTEVRDESDRRAALEERPQRGQRRADSRVVRDRAIFERHVEVDAHESAFSADIGVPDRPFVEGHTRASGQRRPGLASWRRRTP
jgi:hypothetical protein